MSGFGNIPPFYTGYNPAQVADYLRGATQTWTGVNTFLNAASQLKFGTAVDQGAITGTATNATFAYGAEYNGSAYQARQTSATIFSASDVAFTWNLNSGLTPGNTFTPTERMRLDATGLGIGTPTPGCKLEVAGNARISGTSNPTSGAGLEMRYGSDLGELLAYDRTGGVYKDLKLSGATINLAQSGNAIATITGTGLGIGTTNPNCKVDAAGTIRATGATNPTSGAGVEILYFSGEGYVTAYDRTTPSYSSLKLRGSSVYLQPNGATTLATNSTVITATVPVQFASYTLATLPTAASFPRSQVWCSDHTGGARFVYSDGTNWRDVRTGNIAA